MFFGDGGLDESLHVLLRNVKSTKKISENHRKNFFFIHDVTLLLICHYERYQQNLK